MAVSTFSAIGKAHKTNQEYLKFTRRCFSPHATDGWEHCLQPSRGLQA
jgi:hypothetical protein